MSDIIKLLDITLKKHEIFQALNSCDENQLKKLLEKDDWDEKELNNFCTSCLTNISGKEKFKEITLLFLSKIKSVNAYLFESFLKNDSKDLLEILIQKKLELSEVDWNNVAYMLNKNDIKNFDLLFSVMNQEFSTITLAKLLKMDLKKTYLYQMNENSFSILVDKSDMLKSLKILSEEQEKWIIHENSLVNRLVQKNYNISLTGLSRLEFYPEVEKFVILKQISQEENLNPLKKFVNKI